MSNVCCATFAELVKRPTDEMGLIPKSFLQKGMWSSGQWVIGWFDKYIAHRTTDIRHLTSFGSRFSERETVGSKSPRWPIEPCWRDPKLVKCRMSVVRCSLNL